MDRFNQDVWLCSFPKSGNTYFRFVVANYINIFCKRYSYIDFYNLGEVMPEKGKSNLQEEWKFSNIFPRIIKTHEFYSVSEKGKSVVYLVRDPRDVMVSYFYYVKNRLKNSFEGELEEFVHSDDFGMRALNAHAEGWIKNADYIIKYEELMCDSLSVFSKLFSYLNVAFSEAILKESISLSSPARMKFIERKFSRPNHSLNFKKDFRFVRDARVYQWKDSLSKKLANEIYSMSSELLKVHYEK